MRQSVATWVLLVAALLISSAGAATREKHHPSWMVGKWARVGPTQSIKRPNCPEPEFYGRNGYVTYSEVGGADKWWIEGDRLVRVVVEPEEGGSPSEVGRIFKQRFTRNRSGDLIFKGHGYTQKLIRCGHVSPAWMYQPRR